MFCIARLPTIFARLSYLFGLVVLSACSTVNVVEDPTKTPPKSGESIVALSITGNTAQVTAVDKITVRRADIAEGDRTAQIYSLLQVAAGLSRDTSVFVGAMPAGQYEFVSFENQETRRSLKISETMRKTIGRFAVNQGQSVDLGRLIVTPVNARVIVGRSASQVSNISLIKRFSPRHAALFLPDISPGWITGRSPEDDVESYALQRPVGADNPVELADGRVVAASRLGSILVRHPGGRWRVIGSDVRESLLYVLPVQRADAQLIAVGELGTMLRLPPGQDRLVPMDAGNVPPGTLLFIDGDDKFGWFVAVQRAEEIVLLRSDRLEHGEWKPIRTESASFDLWRGRNRVWFWRRPGGLGYAVSTGAFNFLDYASGTWSAASAPKDTRLIAIAPDDHGTMSIMTSPGAGFGGVFASLFVSSDSGRNWREIKSDFKTKVSPPRTLKSGALLMPGGVMSTPELHVSSDGGKTWQKRSDFRLDRRLHTLPSGGLLAVDLGQFGLFSIRYSGDEAATWVTEYSNFDESAYEAQRRP